MSAWSYSVFVHLVVLTMLGAGIVIAVRDAIRDHRRDRRRRR